MKQRLLPSFGKLVRKYGKDKVRQKKNEIQIDADEVWEEDELVQTNKDSRIMARMSRR